MATDQFQIYCECTPVFETEFDRESDRSLAEVVVHAVATVAKTDPIELPTLYEYVDPDALNSLFDTSGAAESTVYVSITMDRWSVFVRDDGTVRVCDTNRKADPKPVFERETV